MIPTIWGYDLASDVALEEIITSEEFDELTASKYSADIRIIPNIKAVSAAIRDYCGWHVYPSRECVIEKSFYDLRVSGDCDTIRIQLPATYVSAISSVSIDGVGVTGYNFDRSGLLRIWDIPRGIEKQTVIRVEYTAGIPDGAADAVKELAACRVTHAMANSYGVTSEASGGVSVTYNSAWANNASSGGLSQLNKESLTPYKRMEVV
jgi:hypothetical protein